MKSNSGLDLPVLRRGSFYYIKEDGASFVLEDRTKRGLTVREQSANDSPGITADRGVIYDMDGIGHTVTIRWYFAKSSHNLESVVGRAEAIEKKYTELRELTCPDD